MRNSDSQAMTGGKLVLVENFVRKFLCKFVGGKCLVKNARWKLVGEQFLVNNFLEGIFLVESSEFWSIWFPWTPYLRDKQQEKGRLWYSAEGSRVRLTIRVDHPVFNTFSAIMTLRLNSVPCHVSKLQHESPWTRAMSRGSKSKRAETLHKLWVGWGKTNLEPNTKIGGNQVHLTKFRDELPSIDVRLLVQEDKIHLEEDEDQFKTDSYDPERWLMLKGRSS